MYKPEQWVPKTMALDVFHVQLDNLEDIKILLGATSIRQAYNRNRTILIEWTMMHRETFSALVGQYILRNHRGEFEVLDPEDLREDYQPYIPEVKMEKVTLTHPDLGRLVAVEKKDGEFSEVLFETPDGSPITFDVRRDEKKDESVRRDEKKDEAVRRDNPQTPKPGPNRPNQHKVNNHNKEKN